VAFPLITKDNKATITIERRVRSRRKKEEKAVMTVKCVGFLLLEFKEIFLLYVTLALVGREGKLGE
jgi:hypothetical protein